MIGGGLRITLHKKRTLIAYGVEANEVTILGIFHGGQGYRSRWSEGG